MPAGKTYENIGQTVTLGSNTLSYTFTNISQNYTDLILVGNTKASVTGAATSFRVNNLTSVADYGHAYLSRSGATTYSGNEFNSAYGVCQWFTTPGTTDGCMFITEFLNYTGTHHNKTYWSRATSLGSDSSYQGNDMISGTVNTTSAITSIKLSMQENASNTINAGSTFTLYGIKAA